MDIIFHGVFHLVDNRIEALLCVFYRKYEKSPNSVEPVSEIVWNCLVTVFHLLYNPICNYNNEPIEVARSHRHIYTTLWCSPYVMATIHGLLLEMATCDER